MSRYWYFVGNSRTGQCFDIVERSAAAACKRGGWSMQDCVVIRVGQAPPLIGYHEPTDHESASRSVLEGSIGD